MHGLSHRWCSCWIGIHSCSLSGAFLYFLFRVFVESLMTGNWVIFGYDLWERAQDLCNFLTIVDLLLSHVEVVLLSQNIYIFSGILLLLSHYVGFLNFSWDSGAWIRSLICVYSSRSWMESVFEMQTNYGDIEFGFYPSVAPKTVKHIFKLVRLGCYNTNHFFRVMMDNYHTRIICFGGFDEWKLVNACWLVQVDKGFVAQVADVSGGRTAPMNEVQKLEADKTIVGEFSDVKHVRGILSMGR